jgi:hypothetical protein
MVQLWPMWTRLSSFAPRPMRVSPMLARSMQVLAWSSASLSTTTLPDWTILCQRPVVFVVRHLGEAETVAAYDDSVLEQDVVA